jgi:hypothetical protein
MFTSEPAAHLHIVQFCAGFAQAANPATHANTPGAFLSYVGAMNSSFSTRRPRTRDR